MSEADALLGVRFALSHPVTSFLQPQDPVSADLALKVTPKFTPLSPEEAETLKREAMDQAPMFRHPQQARQACVEDPLACDGIRLA